MHLITTLICLSAFICVVGGFSQTKANKVGRPTVVVAAPSSFTTYYEEYYSEIMDFLVEYGKHVENDNFIILGDLKAYKYFNNSAIKLPIDRFLYARIGDIWMRDLSSIGKKELTMFAYSPDYLPKFFRPIVRESFLASMKYHGIDQPYDDESNIVIDGGNVVDDGVNSAILTTRIYKDNKDLSPEEIVEEIGEKLNYENIIVIEEYPGDTTGHSDGMVSFVDTNQLAVSRLGFGVDDGGDTFADRTFKQLKSNLTQHNITVFHVPNRFEDSAVKFRNFTSACGSHVDSLVTDEYLYMPTYGCASCKNSPMFTEVLDSEVKDVISKHTTKTIVEVPVPQAICRMGGNLRRLAWQVKGEIADTLVTAAQEANYAARDMEAIEDAFPELPEEAESSESSSVERTGETEESEGSEGRV